MFQKLEAVEKRYEELNKKIADPEIIARTSEWTGYMKEHAEIEEVVLKYKEYKKCFKIYCNYIVYHCRVKYIRNNT